MNRQIVNLTPEKLELLKAILEKKGLKLSGPKSVAPGTPPDSYPLSFAQQRLWFLDQLEPGNPFYNLFVAFRLTGKLDMRALQLSLNEIVERHETLRTNFVVSNGQPRQVISENRDLTINVANITALKTENREEAARLVIAAEGQRPFDL